MSTLTDYYQRVAFNRAAYLSWRTGQCYFNTLVDMRPDLANEVRGGQLDPYYNDDVLKAFLYWVATHWTQE